VDRRDNLDDESGSLDGKPRWTTAVGGGGTTGDDFKGVIGEERLEIEAMGGSWWGLCCVCGFLI